MWPFKKKPKGMLLPIESSEIYEKCKKYMYVNFYTTTNKERIIIYAPNFVGGGGEMCDLPPRFHNLIRKNNITKAEIIDIDKNQCIIKII